MTLSRFLQRVGRASATFLGRESWVVKQARPAYETILARATLGRGIDWAINGEVFRIDPRQRHRLREQYEPQVASYLRSRVRTGSVCVDVGANVGAYVLQFARWSGQSGRIIAFEPNPKAADILRKHVEMNGLTQQVEVVQIAVAEQPGTGPLFAVDADGMSRLFVPNPALSDGATPIEVELTSLDTFFAHRDRRIDWLFVDVEGFELAVLSGARNLIAAGRPSLGIVVEMHPNAWGSASDEGMTAEKLLRELGVRAVPLSGQTLPLQQYGQVRLAYV